VRIDLSLTDRYAPDRLMVHTQPHTTQNVINQKPKLVCNSEGTGELPEDGTQLPKHVGAAVRTGPLNEALYASSLTLSVPN
jgi:hypothetical protein